jgi:hypothetical protein
MLQGIGVKRCVGANILFVGAIYIIYGLICLNTYYCSELVTTILDEDEPY